jgi:ribosomal protein L11
MKLKSPVSSDLIKWKAKVKKGSGEPNRNKV